MPLNSYFAVHHVTRDVAWQAHLHDFYEFYFVLSDNVAIETEHGIYNATYGDFFIFEPYFFHKISAPDILFDRYCIGIKEEDLLSSALCLREAFAAIKESRLHHLQANVTTAAKLIKIFDRAIRSYEDTSPFRDFRIISCIGEIMRIISTLPHGSKGIPHPKNKISAIMKYIHTNSHEEINIDHICKTFGLGTTTLHKIFKEHLNISPGEYILRVRLNNAIDLLKEGKSVTETANLSGFNSYSHFIRIFKSRIGMPPHKYAKSDVNVRSLSD